MIQVVIDFTGAINVIPLVPEMFHHRYGIFYHRTLPHMPPVIFITVKSGCVRMQTGQKTRPGRSAQRIIGISMSKLHTLFHQTVNIRRFRLWMPAHASNRVVQVIRNEKYNIGLLFPGRSG